jgi:hypothetical protein
MRSRAARLVLLGLFVATIAAAAYSIWAGESQLKADARGARAFDARLRAVGASVLDLRHAQQAYVAAGQGEGFWIAKAAALLTSTRDGMAALRASATSSVSQSHIDEAAAALQDFEAMDRRAREYATSGQRLLASDLIFSDGLEKTSAAVTALEQARITESERYETAAAAEWRRQMLLAAGAAAAALLIVLALLPLPPAPQVVQGEYRTVSRTAAGVVGSEDADLAGSVSLEAPSWTPPRRDQDVAARRGNLQPPPGEVSSPAPIDLGPLAALCTDLARVVETRALPPALERAAALLDANGIILWIADPDGRELNAIVAHGYPAQLVTRLGTIPKDADNVTAAAFRTALVQTVAGDGASNGAIAAPLVTPGGCVGVMAAEVRRAGEKQDAKLAAAAIVAAQLATLVGPPSSRAPVKAEAAGA